MITTDFWSDLTWQQHLPIYQATQRLPFIQELISGKLDPARFHFYIEQDALYLQSFTKLLQIMADRIEEPLFKSYFHGFILENMTQEQALHDQYLQKPLTEIRPTETCQAFIHYNAELETLPIPLALAGMLPCFIVYQQLGKFIFEQHSRQGNPYLTWIDTYAGIEHSESVAKLREICDKYALNADLNTIFAMHQWYKKGCLLDQQFWHKCYKMHP